MELSREVFEDAIDVAEVLRDAREVFEDAIDVAEVLRGARMFITDFCFVFFKS